MLFWVVSGDGRVMGVLGGNDNRRRERCSFGDEFEASRRNQCGLCCIVV